MHACVVLAVGSVALLRSYALRGKAAKKPYAMRFSPYGRVKFNIFKTQKPYTGVYRLWEHIKDGDLDLSCVGIVHIPTEEMGMYPEILTLDLSQNNIRDLTMDFCMNLSQITTLDLSSNKLKRLPQNIGKLTSLTVLNLYNNQVNL